MTYGKRINIFLPSCIKAKMDLISEDMGISTKELTLNCLEEGMRKIEHPLMESVLLDVKIWKEKTMGRGRR